MAIDKPNENHTRLVLTYTYTCTIQSLTSGPSAPRCPGGPLAPRDPIGPGIPICKHYRMNPKWSKLQSHCQNANHPKSGSIIILKTKRIIY